MFELIQLYIHVKKAPLKGSFFKTDEGWVSKYFQWTIRSSGIFVIYLLSPSCFFR